MDALALRAEERRDKLRKATGRSKYLLIRGYLNGETRLSKPQSTITESIGYEKETRGTETSKYPQEEKSKEIALVAASERARGQTTSLLVGL